MAQKTVPVDNSERYPQDIQTLREALIEAQEHIAALVLLTTELRTELSEHTHSGVTVGAGDTGASTAIAAPAVVL